MPASTVASISVNAYVVGRNRITSILNQMISRAKETNPDTANVRRTSRCSIGDERRQFDGAGSTAPGADASIAGVTAARLFTGNLARRSAPAATIRLSIAAMRNDHEI